ncbi:ankyrin repeat domain-containing protein [Spongisporangium articulatum]|uniref:Ankyrin repeat domain-containing protein n=1 Tax=Spongisporangium articulatum TaxID=3362603 RepID=A0ABW8AIH1_9ACTN
MPSLPRHPDPDPSRRQAEVERRGMLDHGDVTALRALLTADPASATAGLENWRDHPLGASPLGYVAMLRYDTATNRWRDVPGAANLARELLAAGAPVDGDQPPPVETPLITAASYGDAAVALVLIEAGADLEARAAADSGGVPGGTALLHAAVFGMTDVVDLLVRAGARVPDDVLAAAAGTLTTAPADEGTRLLALMMAAHHQRLTVLDVLLDAGTPVDAVEPVWGRQALRLAAREGRPDAVRHLLARGADPTLRDDEGRDSLALCRQGRAEYEDPSAHDEVERLLLAALAARG